MRDIVWEFPSTRTLQPTDFHIKKVFQWIGFHAWSNSICHGPDEEPQLEMHWSKNHWSVIHVTLSSWISRIMHRPTSDSGSLMSMDGRMQFNTYTAYCNRERSATWPWIIRWSLLTHVWTQYDTLLNQIFCAHKLLITQACRQERSF